MFFPSVISLITLVTLPYLSSATTSSSSSSSSSSSVEGLQVALARKLTTTSVNQAKNLRSLQWGDGNDIDICQVIETHLGDDFILGHIDGSCGCEGNIMDKLSLECSFDNVCDNIGVLCASMSINVTLSGIFNENGGLGLNPTMTAEACADVNVDFIKEMCLSLDFAQPDFFLPDDCGFTYDGNECICEIDFDVPCFEFNCSDVTPQFLQPSIVSSSCQEVTLGRNTNAQMFLPKLNNLPSDLPGLDFIDEGNNNNNNMNDEQSNEEIDDDEEDVNDSDTNDINNANNDVNDSDINDDNNANNDNNNDSQSDTETDTDNDANNDSDTDNQSDNGKDINDNGNDNDNQGDNDNGNGNDVSNNGNESDNDQININSSNSALQSAGYVLSYSKYAAVMVGALAFLM